MNRGFSLVELSIVLVILGLLTGGILAGQSLIRAAELRSVSTEQQRYSTALGAFRDKYFQLPGDMTNAVKFWGQQAGGTADGVDAACVATTTGGVAATGTLTCNGNGDGLIGNTVATYYEWHRAWQQLANAGLLEGSYTGISSTTSNTVSVAPGINSPRPKLSGAGWTLRGMGQMVSDVNFFAGDYGNALQFGGPNPADWTNAPILKPEEAWNLDTKMDDGLPQSGRIVPYKNATRPNCAVATNDAYALSITTAGCNLMFMRVI